MEGGVWIWFTLSRLEYRLSVWYEKLFCCVTSFSQEIAPCTKSWHCSRLEAESGRNYIAHWKKKKHVWTTEGQTHWIQTEFMLNLSQNFLKRCSSQKMRVTSKGTVLLIKQSQGLGWWLVAEQSLRNQRSSRHQPDHTWDSLYPSESQENRLWSQNQQRLQLGFHVVTVSATLES